MQKISYKLILFLIFTIFAVILLIKNEYGLSVLLLFGLLLIVKIDGLINFALSLKDGLRAEFRVPKEKIEEDIKENKEEVTQQNYLRVQDIEYRILAEQQKKYGREMKTGIQLMCGLPDKPQFTYIPDGSLQTDDVLYLFEIKYISKPEYVNHIANKTTQNLKDIYRALKSSVGKKLIIKLILVSSFDIDINSFKASEGIEIEFTKM